MVNILESVGEGVRLNKYVFSETWKETVFLIKWYQEY